MHVSKTAQVQGEAHAHAADQSVEARPMVTTRVSQRVEARTIVATIVGMESTYCASIIVPRGFVSTPSRWKMAWGDR